MNRKRNLIESDKIQVDTMGQNAKLTLLGIFDINCSVSVHLSFYLSITVLMLMEYWFLFFLSLKKKIDLMIPYVHKSICLQNQSMYR